MTKRKGKKNLKKLEVSIRVSRASDFPQAPGLLALMFAGKLARSISAPKYTYVADGHE